MGQAHTRMGKNTRTGRNISTDYKEFLEQNESLLNSALDTLAKYVDSNRPTAGALPSSLGWSLFYGPDRHGSDRTSYTKIRTDGPDHILAPINT